MFGWRAMRGPSHKKHKRAQKRTHTRPHLSGRSPTHERAWQEQRPQDGCSLRVGPGPQTMALLLLPVHRPGVILADGDQRLLLLAGDVELDLDVGGERAE